MRMRKIFYLTALLVGVAGFSACSGDEESLTGVPVIPSQQQSEQEPLSGAVWHVKTTGLLSDISQTRALSMGGSTGIRLYTNWEAGDVVNVYSGTTQLGMLTVTVDAMNPSKADLEGTITGATLSVGDRVTFCLPSKAMDFTGQNGTLAAVSSSKNFMTASVAVTAVDADTHELTLGSAAFTHAKSFAILKFKDSSGNWLRPTQLVITAQSGKLVQSVAADGTVTTGSLTINTVQEDGMYPYKLFVVLKNDNTSSNETYTFTVTTEDGTVYTSTDAAASKLTRTDVYADGQYYAPDAFTLYNGTGGMTNTITGWGSGGSQDENVNL